MAVIVFCGVAGKVLLADYRRLLVNGLNLGQPSFIYAYLALLVQSGMYENMWSQMEWGGEGLDDDELMAHHNCNIRKQSGNLAT